MELKKLHITGIIIGILIFVLSIFLYSTKFFFFLIGLALLSIISPFVISVILETKIAAQKEEMFLEFVRNLSESVKTGTPINKSIVNVKDKSYGVLSENIRKLANQISMGIPLNTALQTFANDVNNKTISRSLTLIGQAERSGGEIGQILEAVTEAVTLADKLKKERKSAISTLVVQGYIIFFIFIVIVLVLQFQILPLLVGLAPTGGESIGIGGFGIGGVSSISTEDISSSFLYLLLVQGLFSGLTIGKLSEGTMKPGIKHSFILMLFAFLISTGANLFFGS